MIDHDDTMMKKYLFSLREKVRGKQKQYRYRHRYIIKNDKCHYKNHMK